MTRGSLPGSDRDACLRAAGRQRRPTAAADRGGRPGGGGHPDTRGRFLRFAHAPPCPDGYACGTSQQRSPASRSAAGSVGSAWGSSAGTRSHRDLAETGIGGEAAAVGPVAEPPRLRAGAAGFGNGLLERAVKPTPVLTPCERGRYLRFLDPSSSGRSVCCSRGAPRVAHACVIRTVRNSSRRHWASQGGCSVHTEEWATRPTSGVGGFPKPRRCLPGDRGCSMPGRTDARTSAAWSSTRRRRER